MLKFWSPIGILWFHHHVVLKLDTLWNALKYVEIILNEFICRMLFYLLYLLIKHDGDDAMLGKFTMGVASLRFLRESDIMLCSSHAFVAMQIVLKRTVDTLDVGWDASIERYL